MAGSSGNDDDGMVSGINVTPLVDVCLVLMVILMVTARMIDQKSMPLDLPKAATGQEVMLVFTLDLHANGESDVNDKRLARYEDMLPLAKEALAKNPDLRAVIKADTTVQHGRVIRALDLLKQAGISKIAFGVTPIATEAGRLTPDATAAPPAPAPAPNPETK
jgi:biopolymer transport protein ExbD